MVDEWRKKKKTCLKSADRSRSYVACIISAEVIDCEAQGDVNDSLENKAAIKLETAKNT